MSTDQKLPGTEAEDQPVAPHSDVEPDFVPKKAYTEVSSDMHKFKQRAKEEAARRAELEAKLEALERAEMEKQQKWETLYKQEQERRAELERRVQQEKDLYLRSIKKSALKAELGNIKDVYLVHADLDGIEITEDGSLDYESVKSVANRFRNDHPQLVGMKPGNNITNTPSPTGLNQDLNPSRTAGEMSLEEKKKALYQMRLNKLNQ